MIINEAAIYFKGDKNPLYYVKPLPTNRVTSSLGMNDKNYPRTKRSLNINYKVNINLSLASNLTSSLTLTPTIMLIVQ